jgi:hypothetical protein
MIESTLVGDGGRTPYGTFSPMIRMTGELGDASPVVHTASDSESL